MTYRMMLALAVVMAAPAAAQTRGSAGSPFTAPATKSAGENSERAQAGGGRDLPLEPRHGIFAAPGAAPDSYGPTRLGAGAPVASLPSYGESSQGGGATPWRTWQSGDRVRSPSSADVRKARQEQAPDLDFVAGAAGAAAGGAPERPAAAPAPAAKKKQITKRR